MTQIKPKHQLLGNPLHVHIYVQTKALDNQKGQSAIKGKTIQHTGTVVQVAY